MEEKIRIGQKYLVPKQMREHGLTADHLTLPESTLRDIGSRFLHGRRIFGKFSNLF